MLVSEHISRESRAHGNEELHPFTNNVYQLERRLAIFESAAFNNSSNYMVEHDLLRPRRILPAQSPGIRCLAILCVGMLLRLDRTLILVCLVVNMQGRVLVEHAQNGWRIDIAQLCEDLYVWRYARVETDVVGRLGAQEEVGDEERRQRVLSVHELHIVLEAVAAKTLRYALCDKVRPVFGALLQRAASDQRMAFFHWSRQPK